MRSRNFKGFTVGGGVIPVDDAKRVLQNHGLFTRKESVELVLVHWAPRSKNKSILGL